MRFVFTLSLFVSCLIPLLGQEFVFSYEGPDTLFVDENCEVALNWGHPDQPTVESGIGANIDSFYIFSISGDYELNELVGPALSIEITYKAVDDLGNEGFFTFQLITYDSIPPVLTTNPQDVSISCSDQDVITQLMAWYENDAGIEATDNCEANIVKDKTWDETLIEFNQSINNNCGNTRSVELSFTITDLEGNEIDGGMASFSTFDLEDPEFTSLPTALDTFCVPDINIILEEWIDKVGGSEAIDNCSDDLEWYFLWSIENTSFSGYEKVGNKPYDLQLLTELCEFDVNVNFFAEDACGNREARFTSIHIVDNNLPYFVLLPQDTLVDCDNLPEPVDMIAMDDCKGELIVLFESESNQGDDPLQSDFYNYDIVQTWTASDGCVDDISHSRTIFVRDTISPDFVVPDDITINCTQILNIPLTGIPQMLTDNCSAEFEISTIDRKEGDGCDYIIYRDWIVKDMSGNERLKTQTLFVLDDEAPQVINLPVNETISCSESDSPEILYNDWLNQVTDSDYNDVCSDAFVFTALPGSYDIQDPGSFPGDFPNSDFLLNCTGEEFQLMFKQTVDFVYYDECGNAVVHSREFRVIDDQAPTFQNCPADTIISLQDDACTAVFEFFVPPAEDNCTGSPLSWNFLKSFPINSQVPGDTEIPVDTMTVSLGPVNLNLLDLEEVLNLQLSFFNVDADDNGEYYTIRGEDGNILTTTPEIDEECGDFTMDLKDFIPVELLEEWLQDGFLVLDLEPNIVPEGGVFSINDICENSFVEFNLSYTTEAVSQLSYEYSFDSIQFLPVTPNVQVDTLLPYGAYRIYYRVNDCARNITTCAQDLMINDIQPPEIVCPDDLIFLLEPDSCSLQISLPDEFLYSDNCLDNWQLTDIQPLQEERYIHFNYDQNSEVFIASNKNIDFDLNATAFIDNPVLTVFIKGDVDEANEFFEILDEDGQLIGQTPLGSCDSITSVGFNLETADVNRWVQDDGQLAFVARSAVGVNPINPCNPSLVQQDGDHDGESVLYFQLSYDQVNLRYSISGATEISERDFNADVTPPVHEFFGGHSVLEYILLDQALNADTCSTRIVLEDRQNPTAVCKEAIAIFINPSGIDDYILDPEMLDAGSFDNCAVDSMAVVPSVFDCSQAGSTVEVMFYVWDAFGNVDSCMTNVKVETEVLNPSYQAGVCAFDTLKLFANLPDAPENIYTILWTKQNNGYSSNEENPVRPNADASYSGTYTLEVTGLGGCFSTGFVDVFIEDLTTPDITISKDTICTGEIVLLETNNYSGNVIYNWYEGIPPNGMLLNSTTAPNLAVQASNGLHDYYVEVVSENCISPPSLKNTLVVLTTPEASVNDPFLNLCEGEDIVLGTNVSGPAYEYLWWGPDSYFSTDQNPQIIEAVEIINQGTYRLAIFNGICSDTAQVEVLVNERPVTPVIDADSVYCEDEIMVLSVGNITNADRYFWYLGGILQTVDESNTLVIPEAGDLFAGDWQVVAKEGNCFSDTSLVKNIEVEVKFEISATNSGPVCEGDSVQLLAPELPGASYLWIDPENDSIPESRPEILAKQGVYFLEVTTEAGCQLDASTEVQIVQVPEITALSNDAPNCIDGTECITFNPSVFPNLPDYSYSWEGPNGYTSQDSVAVICDIDTSQNGVYSLYVSNGVCESEIVQTSVEMYEYPDKAVLNGGSLLCETDTLVITTLNGYAEGHEFYWSTPGGNIYQTNTSELILPKAEIGFTGYYSLQVFNGNCYSVPSDSIYIEVIKKPNQPVAWTENAFCEGEPIKLYTNFVEGAEYYWEGPNEFTSSVQNPVIFPSDTLAEGVYRVFVSVDGCTSEISEAVVVQITRKPATPEIVSDLQPICLSDFSQSFELCLEQQDPATSYTWYHNNSNTELGTFASACIEVSGLQGVVDGINSFYVLGESSGCMSDPSELVEIQLNLIPEIEAYAGEDIVVCNDESLYLEALGNDEGVWTSSNPQVNIAEGSNPNTQVFNLLEGDNIFIWSLSHGVCYDYDRDTVIIHIIPTPVAIDDHYTTGYNQEITLDPVINDLFGDDAEVIIDDSNISHGTLEHIGPNSFNFIPSPEFVGEVIISYILQHRDCTEKITTAEIFIKIAEADDCFGMNVITPNGDGVNDELHFPCLENPLFPLNKLTVFNQWGDEVFSQSPYENNWAGTYRGKDLPVGTYYYILDLRNGSKPIRDFVVIER